MKKPIKKILVSSLAALAFGAMTVGTTFALFTSQAKTSIEIEAGKVKVDQEFEILSVKELGDVDVLPNEGVYTNSIGGKTYVDATTGELKLEKWVPGDKAVVRVTSVNNSNVVIKTRFNTSHSSTSTPDLYDALDIDYAFTAGYSQAITDANYTEWTNLEVPQTDNKAILSLDITIEFPDSHNGEITFGSENDDNQYQDTNCAILFTQEAVQGNAHIPDTSKGYADSYEEVVDDVTYEVNELSEPEHFEQMLEDLGDIDVTDAEELEEAKNTIYRLSADIDMEGSDNINQGILCGTLDGNGHTIENIEYVNEDAPAAGLFAKYYDGAKVEDLTLENVTIQGKENVGALFGQSYAHASGASATQEDTELTIENVTIGDNVIVSGTKGVGGIAGSTRWIEKLTLRNVVNNADVSAEVYNVGGFFGTLAGVKTLIAENCINNGNIRGPHNVAGFVGQSPALESVTITNCENHGRITDFSSNKGSEANAGWFVACTKSGATLNYSGNVNDGVLYYVTENSSFINVFEAALIGDDENAGIRIPTGKTVSDYKVLDDTVLLSYELVNNQFVISPVTGADHYTISMQVWARDVRLEGNTATVYKEKYLAYTRTYNTVGELHDSFGHITRAGYFLDNTYTEYDYDPTGGVSNNATKNGRANFFRLPYAQKATYEAKYTFGAPCYDEDLGEWVFILDSEADCLPGTGRILSPKNTIVTYVITAYDAGNHAISNAVHYDDGTKLEGGDDSGSYLLNMAGEKFLSAGPGTDSGDKVYDPVA